MAERIDWDAMLFKVKLEDDAEEKKVALKPCPFCGGEATLTKENGRFYVSCENDKCGVGVETTLWVSGTMESAVEAWNRRADNEAITVADVEAILEKVVNRADKHGYWIERRTWGEFLCSECKTLGSPQWKRCPICEAKMDGGDAE